MPETAAVKLTRELVQADSTPTGSVSGALHLAAGRLEESGFALRWHRYGGNQQNLLATFGDPEVPAVCLTGHLDTVPVITADWSRDPWGAEIDDGLLYGRGVADMKAGVAAAVEAAITFTRRQPDAELSLVLTAQEELGSLGAAALAHDGVLPRASHLVVAEPTDMLPRMGHRGAFWADVHGHGRSCHGSTPQLGKNAIWALTEDLRWLADIVAAAPTHELLGPATMNVGILNGGVQRNIVPDRASAQIDIRLASRDLSDHLNQLSTVRLPNGSDLVVATSLRPVATDPDHPMLRLAAEIAATSEVGAARFFTDASVLTSALGGVPTVIWGPGSPDQAHVVDEYCPVEHIELAVAYYVQLLSRISHSR